MGKFVNLGDSSVQLTDLLLHVLDRDLDGGQHHLEENQQPISFGSSILTPDRLLLSSCRQVLLVSRGQCVIY